MADSFSLFCNYPALGPTLILVGDFAKPCTRFESYGNVTVLYSGSEVIGINIFDTLSSVKIRAAGLINVPGGPLSALITGLVKDRTGLSINLEESPYAIGKIIEIRENRALIDLGTEKLEAAIGFKPIGSFVIVARKDERLPSGPRAFEEAPRGLTAVVIQEAAGAGESDIGKVCYSSGQEPKISENGR